MWSIYFEGGCPDGDTLAETIQQAYPDYQVHTRPNSFTTMNRDTGIFEKREEKIVVVMKNPFVGALLTRSVSQKSLDHSVNINSMNIFKIFFGGKIKERREFRADLLTFLAEKYNGDIKHARS